MHTTPEDYDNGCRQPKCVHAHRARVTETQQAKFVEAVVAAVPEREPLPTVEKPTDEALWR